VRTSVETLKLAIELIELGIEGINAVKFFVAWFRRDPEEAARVAKSRATGMAAGQSAYDAAKAVRSDGKTSP